jgi:toxin ParE1/3/4
MRLRWTEDAIKDLESLRFYIEQDKPEAARNVVKKIFTATENLMEQPDMGRSGRVLGTRELIVSNTPYILPYRVRGSCIEIIRVLHSKMRWPKNF